MKKMLFSAIAMVAFAGTASASNEIVKDYKVEDVSEGNELIINSTDTKYPCTVSIFVIGYNSDGLPYVVDSIAYGSKYTGSACTKWGSGKVAEWEKKYEGCEIKSTIISR